MPALEGVHCVGVECDAIEALGALGGMKEFEVELHFKVDEENMVGTAMGGMLWLIPMMG